MTRTPAPRLAGMSALVTGGSRGIGAGIAIELAAAGADVGIMARDTTAGERVVSAIHELGRNASFFAADLRQEEEVAAAVQQAADRLGGIHVLVNNAALTPARAGTAAAGGASGGTATTIALPLWQRYFEVNVTGALLVTRYALPFMLAAGYGSVIVINSIGIRYVMPGDVGYAASKAALSGLTKSLAVDFAPMVRANELLCGFIPNADNPVHQAILSEPDTRQAVIDSNLTGRCGNVRDIGLACVYLASAESGFITGQAFVLDGGTHVAMRIPHAPKPLGTSHGD